MQSVFVVQLATVDDNDIAQEGCILGAYTDLFAAQAAMHNDAWDRGSDYLPAQYILTECPLFGERDDRTGAAWQAVDLPRLYTYRTYRIDGSKVILATVDEYEGDY